MFYLYLCMLKIMDLHQYLQLQSNTTRFILVFSLFLFVTSFSHNEESNSVIFNILFNHSSCMWAISHHHCPLHVWVSSSAICAEKSVCLKAVLWSTNTLYQVTLLCQALFTLLGLWDSHLDIDNTSYCPASSHIPYFVWLINVNGHKAQLFIKRRERGIHHIFPP